jgi:putative oxygen-independent coproporphyrinogen III oxidase
VRPKIEEDPWVEGILKELQHYNDWLGSRKISTIFFGGGTPSLISPQKIEFLLQEIVKTWEFENDIEITLEANPNSIEVSRFIDFKQAGINRVSVGIQSLRNDVLKFLGREHSADEAKKAIEIASSVFERFSFDLIYTRPNQTIDEWQVELGEALQYATSHLSLYQLTIEEGTPFYQAARRGDFTMPDEDLAAEFYEVTGDMLRAQGLQAYEVSNYAKLSHEAQHNLIYWRYQDYVGLGPGAHGRVKHDGVRYALHNVRSPEKWLRKQATGEFGAREPLIKQQQIQERILMGLRLEEGINRARFQHEFGLDIIEIFNNDFLNDMIKSDYIALNNEIVRINPKGILLLNYLIKNLL